MKDKAWLKEKIQTMINEEYKCYDPLIHHDKHTCRVIMHLVDQLDEPEQTDIGVGLSKPVVPQFVADYIEKWEYEGLIMHEWFTFDHDNQDEEKVSKWLYNNDNETNKRREFMLIDAIRYGYEVERENIYYVLDKEDVTLLKKSLTGEGADKSVGVNINNVKSWKDKKEYQLTEQEIKDYDKRYIPFMVPVDEMNNDCTWAFAEEVKE